MSRSSRLLKENIRGVALACMLLAAAPAAAALVPRAPAPAAGDPTLRCELASAYRNDQWFRAGGVMPLTSYDDDPSVDESVIECVPYVGFIAFSDLGLVLWNNHVWIWDEDVVYRANRDGLFFPFAWNPWPVIPTANADGSFRFPDEPRFPEFVIVRGPDGRPILRDGLQVWAPLDLHQGATTTFEAASKVKDAAEEWSGRYLHWGTNGTMLINAHSFIDFNAFFSPASRQLFFGVTPYRDADGVVRIFETASSWEVAAHESGHAVHVALKPNVDVGNAGFRTWSESFADQMAMWTALRDRGRARALLGHGPLGASNGLSRMGEAWGFLVGSGEPMRDAVNDAKVSTTPPEVHDRSEVLTGALYRLFVSIYEELKPQGAEQALAEAGARMGTFVTRATDYTPENTMTLADVGKAHLKVDAEFFGGRYRDRLVKEFKRRQIFDASSLGQWLAHEAAVPKLRLPFGRDPRDAAALVQQSLDALGIGPDFGLAVQSVVRDDHFRQTIVRVQLTHGRGPGAAPLDNHGILVFRENGSLADYHAPLPTDAARQAQALALLDHARHIGLDRHGAPLSIVRRPSGELGVEARVLRGDGPSVWMDAFTLEAPYGERRDVVSRSWGNPAQAERLKRAGIVLTGDQISQ